MILRVFGSLDVWKEVFSLKNDLVGQFLAVSYARYLPASVSNIVSRLVAGSIVSPLSSNSLIFNVTGTQHILALSGFHINVVVNSCRKLYTAFFSKKLQLIFSTIVVFTYFLFVGFSHSLLRAVVMYLISTFCSYFGRQKQSLVILAHTCLLVFLVDVSIFSSVSFQLSFVATVAILVYSSINSKQKNYANYAGIEDFTSTKLTTSAKNLKTKIIGYINETFQISCFIQLCLLPIISYYFASVSLLSPFSSVLILWIFPYLVPAALLIFILSFVLPSIVLFPIYILVFLQTGFALFLLRLLSFQSFLIEIPQISLFQIVSIYSTFILIYSTKIAFSWMENEKTHSSIFRFGY